MFQNLKKYFLQMLPKLSEEAWMAYERMLVVKEYKKGEVLSEEGKQNNTVSFISNGAVMVYNHVDGKKRVYNFFFENEYTGDYESFLTQRPAKYGLEAIEDVTVFNLSYPALQKIYADYPEFERVGRLVAESQFLRVTQRNASLLSEKPEDRYQNLIKEKPQVTMRVPQYYIAAYLGITPEALSRIRRRLSAKEMSHG